MPLLGKYNVRHFNVSLYPRRAFQLVRDLPRLKYIVQSEQPEIIHAHMVTNAIYMRLGRSLAGFGSYGLVTTIHNEWRLTSHLMRAGDRVIVLSDHGKKTFINRGFPDHKLRIVPHGILHSPRRLSEVEHEQVAPPVQDRAPLIVTMAGLYRRKGIGDLIAAFGQIANEFPKASLLVLGWGPDQASFERQKNSVRGGERIHLQGFVAKPRSILRQPRYSCLRHTLSRSRFHLPKPARPAAPSWPQGSAAFLSCSNTAGRAYWFHRMIRMRWREHSVAYSATRKNLLTGAKHRELTWSGCLVPGWHVQPWRCMPVFFENWQVLENLIGMRANDQ